MKELKRILLLDPSIATFNVGDKIISQSVREHLKPLIDFSFVIEASTHLPVTMYLKNIFYSYDFDYRFVCGSNLIRGKMNIKREKKSEILDHYKYSHGMVKEIKNSNYMKIFFLKEKYLIFY